MTKINLSSFDELKRFIESETYRLNGDNLFIELSDYSPNDFTDIFLTITSIAENDGVTCLLCSSKYYGDINPSEGRMQALKNARKERAELANWAAKQKLTVYYGLVDG